ncbi:MAG: hypothetical protein ACK5LT_08250 [Lachnospirales bacterium]
MEVISEALLRNIISKNDVKEFIVDSNTILTPSAKSFLLDKKIKVIYNRQSNKSNLPEPKKYKFKDDQGNEFRKKPEYMTQIYADKLVKKDHPIIAFRGKLDSTQSKILEAQIIFSKLGYQNLVKDLEEVLIYIKNILKSEVLNTELKEQKLLGLEIDEIRAYSHNPKKYFGINHFEPSYRHGEVIVYLNSLRTYSRELELSGYNAFKGEGNEPMRIDILTALNRLSSLFYIMMFKYLNNGY